MGRSSFTSRSYVGLHGVWNVSCLVLDTNCLEFLSQVHENMFSIFQVVTCGQMDRHGKAKRCVLFMAFHCRCVKRGHNFVLLCSRHCMCFGKLSVYFLTMPVLRKKPPVGTTSLLLSICYYFPIWLGLCTDLSPLNDTWSNPKWARTHWTDCHQVGIDIDAVWSHLMLLSNS